MTGRDLFEIWAPAWQEGWTKFAKPSLFMGVKEWGFDGSVSTPPLLEAIAEKQGRGTAIIVDLPDAHGVTSGLALAKMGYRPVPLYNAVNEEQIGTLTPAIDNSAIVAGLKEGAGLLRQLVISGAAPPAFLLDYDRNMRMVENPNIFDNRWTVDFEDFPEAEYMKASGIERVLLWTAGEMNPDLAAILESYRNAGIETSTFIDTKTASVGSQGFANAGMNAGLGGVAAASAVLSTGIQDDARKFENARVWLMIVGGVAAMNLFFMFFAREAPLWWTSPSIMWLTYLWVPEIVGDIIAVVFVAAYISLYFMSARWRVLLPAAAGLFAIDTAVFYVYMFYYGIDAWFAGLGILLLLAPVIFLIGLAGGVFAYRKIHDATDEEYFNSLDRLDGLHGGTPHGMRRRRHFRGFRGYGGSGYGGYGGSYYGGYGGGCGG